jgi:hypothetical protein
MKKIRENCDLQRSGILRRLKKLENSDMIPKKCLKNSNENEKEV